MGNRGGKLPDNGQTLHVRERAIALLYPLAVGDVDGGTDVTEKFTVLGKARRPLVEDPTVLAVVTAQPIFDFNRLSDVEGGVPNLDTVLTIIGMHPVEPALAELLLQGSSGEFQPARIEKCGQFIDTDHPEHHRRAVGHGAKASFAVLYGALGSVALLDQYGNQKKRRGSHEQVA